MKLKLLICFVLVPSLAALLTGCGGGGGGVASGLDLTDPGSFKAGVDHPYFPMVPGTVWVLEGVDAGRVRMEEVRVLHQPRMIWGIPCMAISETQFLDGVLSEVTTEWFAEDRQGNVWKFGEESLEIEDGTFQRRTDSWVVGEGDALPWMMLSSTPELGERYVGYRPDGQDTMYVQSLTATAITAAGTFFNCLEILENPEDIDDQDIILYAAGVGRVREISSGGQIELTSTRTDP